ncbi:MAG: HNH endonuclease [Bacilli bacterium]|nr:HNH endonuclease [Bacilli bacterium]
MRFSIYARDGNRCRKCGRRTGDLEIDHIIPIAKGGKSTYENLQTLCKSCNKKKGSSLDF